MAPPAAEKPTEGAFVAPSAEVHDVALDFVEQGLDVVIVQPGLVYGPGDTAQSGDLIAQVAKGKRPLAPNGGGVCWAHVDDIADGHWALGSMGTPGTSSSARAASTDCWSAVAGRVRPPQLSHRPQSTASGSSSCSRRNRIRHRSVAM